MPYTLAQHLEELDECLARGRLSDVAVRGQDMYDRVRERGMTSVGPMRESSAREVLTHMHVVRGVQQGSCNCPLFMGIRLTHHKPPPPSQWEHCITPKESQFIKVHLQV